MRLYYGGIPENKNFQPEQEGWSPIREPGPVAVQFLAVPFALAALVLLVGLFLLVLPHQELKPELVFINLPFLGVMLLLIVIIPVHELIHAFLTPGFGLTDKTVIGIWPSRLLFFAYYDEALSRNRFLVVFLAPFFVLSLLPVGLAVLARLLPVHPSLLPSLVLLSLLNGAAASGDLLGFTLVWMQIPSKAQVRNKGWRTYWKV